MIQKVEISAKTIVFTIFFLLSLWVVWLLRELIFALLFAFIFMSALKPAVASLVKRGIPRFLSSLLVFITTITLLVILFQFILPPIIQEALAFIKNLPGLIAHSFPYLASSVDIDSFLQFLPNVTQNALRLVTGLFSNIIFLISVFFFTFYFLLEEQFMASLIERFVDTKKTKSLLILIDRIERRMHAWVWGEIVLLLIIGFATYIGLSFLGIRYALSLAVIAGLLEVVPIIGPIISAVPAFFVAASMSPVLGSVIIVLYIIIQQFENNLIVPIVMKRAVGLHPVMTLIALTVGGKLGGLMGVILSVPIALIIESVLIEYSNTKEG